MSEKLQVAFKDFDETKYLQANLDIAQAVKRGDFESGWDHYLRSGKAENRLDLVQEYAAFDEAQYLQANLDVAQAVKRGDFESGWEHYSRTGKAENRLDLVQEYAAFDEAQYLRANLDVAHAVKRGDFESGWDHYLREGKAENRLDLVEEYANFDETQYLRLNSDIAQAVEKGDFESGWDHYLRDGKAENRPGSLKQYATVKLLSGNTTSIPVPPPDLRARVHGADELAPFHKIGEVVASDLDKTIKSLDLELNDRSNILDFGCGCGRIVSWFQDLHPNSKFFGSDIDSEAITWCQENLSHLGNFSVNPAMPTLPYQDQFFDLLYSISIFTHLPEEMQFAWLKELQRVCKPGAYLLLTVHGSHLFPKNAAESAKAEFNQQGFYYQVEKYSNGLPEFYQTSFHTEAYIRDRWSDFFKIEQIIPKGIANHQDLVICQNIV
ncbi:MAG: class I SAM-dependent methyltransferase [Cyanobacteria bacterium P01_G01_bin.39]